MPSTVITFTDFREWRKSLPPDIRKRVPKKPMNAFKDKGWNGWRDFIGKPPTYTLEQLKSIMPSTVITFTDFREWRNSLPPDIRERVPKKPMKTFKDKGWISWRDFTGQEPYSVEELTAMIAEEEFYFKQEFYRWRRSLPKAVKHKIPPHPDQFYRDKGWPGWDVFFGKNSCSKTVRALSL